MPFSARGLSFVGKVRFEPGDDIDRIAYDREGFGNRRAGRADYHSPVAMPMRDEEVRDVAQQPDDVREIVS